MGANQRDKVPIYLNNIRVTYANPEKPTASTCQSSSPPPPILHTVHSPPPSTTSTTTNTITSTFELNYTQYDDDEDGEDDDDIIPMYLDNVRVSYAQPANNTNTNRATKTSVPAPANPKRQTSRRKQPSSTSSTTAASPRASVSPRPRAPRSPPPRAQCASGIPIQGIPLGIIEEEVERRVQDRLLLEIINNLSAQERNGESYRYAKYTKVHPALENAIERAAAGTDDDHPGVSNAIENFASFSLVIPLLLALVLTIAACQYGRHMLPPPMHSHRLRTLPTLPGRVQDKFIVAYEKRSSELSRNAYNAHRRTGNCGCAAININSNSNVARKALSPRGILESQCCVSGVQPCVEATALEPVESQAVCGVPSRTFGSNNEFCPPTDVVSHGCEWAAHY